MEEEKFIFEDQHAMRLTHYVMAERCMQVEAHKIIEEYKANATHETLAFILCLLYTSPSPRDLSTSRMPSSA